MSAPKLKKAHTSEEVESVEVDTKNNEWYTIESDPAIFTHLIKQMGFLHYKVIEMYGLDADQFDGALDKSDCYGFIFLFKWTKDLYQKINNARNDRLNEDDGKSIFFAKQVADNACATQAILNILLNHSNQSIQMDSNLAHFSKEIKMASSPLQRGNIIKNSQWLRNIHNTHANPLSPYQRDDGKDDDKRDSLKDEDPFHFVAFVPDGCEGVWELDGLQPSPIHHRNQQQQEKNVKEQIGLDSNGNADDWRIAALRVIKERLKSFAGNELRFSLMLIQRDPIVIIKSKLSASIDCLQKAQQNEQKSPKDKESPNECSLLLMQKMQLEDQLEAEQVQRCQDEQMVKEGQYDYMPLAVAMMKTHLKNTGQI